MWNVETQKSLAYVCMLKPFSFPSLELRDPNLFQHDIGTVHNVSSTKTFLTMFLWKKLSVLQQSLDLKPSECF